MLTGAGLFINNILVPTTAEGPSPGARAMHDENPSLARCWRAGFRAGARLHASLVRAVETRRPTRGGGAGARGSPAFPSTAHTGFPARRRRFLSGAGPRATAQLYSLVFLTPGKKENTLKMSQYTESQILLSLLIKEY